MILGLLETLKFIVNNKIKLKMNIETKCYILEGSEKEKKLSCQINEVSHQFMDWLLDFFSI